MSLRLKRGMDVEAGGVLAKYKTVLIFRKPGRVSRRSLPSVEVLLLQKSLDTWNNTV